ncbi:PilZ domain-containing protein [Novosphingobium sp. ST904]|uniref:PilZ domain-containing protein n=1 Tax=Novosphingobium sp. ST904 TaxID=1684385 RepID=UPI0006CD00B8|nr:PilZ domain-containing protein [Novosphingobium sp. ST904]KPH68169.1 pilus assembly protein PilZ [Novosphingobium sp. ST904]TCM23688.1 PilZ domain-containing protein [Novosphingobium sp. ST904]
MKHGPRLNVVDMRASARQPVDYAVIGENRRLGEVPLHIVNISPQGFMIQGAPEIGRGERLQLRLPVIGMIEGHLVWSHEDRAGFQFERLIRVDMFAKLVEQITSPRPPRQGR